MSAESRKTEVPAWLAPLILGIMGGGASGSALTSMGGTNRMPEVLARQEVIIAKLDNIANTLADHEDRLRVLEARRTGK